MESTMMRMLMFMGLALLLAGCTKTIKEADAGRARPAPARPISLT